jgi:B-box zinc finger
MALGDKEDFSCAQHGQGHDVVLYCYTCHIPVCARCVASAKPAETDSPHQEHIFLELTEACEMFKVK